MFKKQDFKSNLNLINKFLKFLNYNLEKNRFEFYEFNQI
jgi:hypothetical protein